MTNQRTRILITGASRGLGRSAALHLARRGADIAITYKGSKGAAEETAKAIESEGGRALVLQLDVSRVDTFAAFARALEEQLAERFGKARLDALVNNAGSGHHAPHGETREADVDRMFAEHFKGPFFLTQALSPLLDEGARVLNVSSGLTRFTVPGYAAYASMKGAVEVLTRYLAQELGPRGIRVNTLAPGAIETDFGGGAVRDNQELNAMLASRTALGRVGLPDDIGGAVAALVSDDAAWINGQRVEASGGMFL